MGNTRRAAGAAGCGLYGLLSLLWRVAGILFFLSIPLAILNWIPWRAVIGWFVLVLLLAGLRAIVARGTDKVLTPLMIDDE